jgi:phage terminase large subunit-like protein
MPKTAEEAFADLTAHETVLVKWMLQWRQQARPKQLPPSNEENPNWTKFGMLTGRGFGKTLAFANWIGQEASLIPKSLNAVVAPTHQDVQTVCFEGPTGLLSVIPEKLIDDYKRSEPITIKLWNGAQIRGFAGDAPERLRGPQHHNAWCLTGDTWVTMADGSARPLMSITCGMMIQTRKGPRRVIAQELTKRMAPLVEVEIDGAITVRGTADHPVFVEGGGFVPMSKMRIGDRVCLISSTTEKSTGGIKTDTTNPTKGDGCIAQSTQTTTGRSRTGGSSTTWITIKKTMIRLISSLCRRVGIPGTTPPDVNRALSRKEVPVKGCATGGENANRTSDQYAQSAENVSSQERSVKHLASAAVDVPKLLEHPHSLLKSGSASSVGALTPPPSAFNAIAPSDAIRMRCITEQEHLNEQSRALPAKKSFYRHERTLASAVGNVPSTINGVCTSVRQLGTRADVFNIEVDNANEFFANGVLVHNCDELASFQYPEEALSNLNLGLRLGHRPRLGWSTTPRPRAFLTQLIAETIANGRVSYGSLYENRENLPESFIKDIAKYEGTQLGRQELYGEIISIEELGVIKRSDWMLWPARKPLPKFSFILMALDTALTEKTVDSKTHDPDYTACAVWGMFEHKAERCFMLLDCWQDRLGLPALIERVRKERRYTYGEQDAPILPPTAFGRPVLYGNFGRPIDLICIEQQGAGRPLIQMLAKEGIFCYEYNPGKADKLQRLHVVSPAFAQHRVFAVESETVPHTCKKWAEPLVTQTCSYAGKGSLPHDDLVDVTSMGLRYLMDNFLGPVTTPAVTVRQTDVQVIVHSENPYTA